MSLISIQDAANALGYSTKGLRKIVARSRAKANGARTRGPTIKFFQTMKGAPVKFRQEWLEEFIEENMVDPTNGVARLNGKRKRSKVTLEFD